MKLGNLKERKNGILPEVPLEFPEVEDGIKTQRYWLRISCETLAYIQMCEKGIAERFHKQYGHEHPTAGRLLPTAMLEDFIHLHSRQYLFPGMEQLCFWWILHILQNGNQKHPL